MNNDFSNGLSDYGVPVTNGAFIDFEPQAQVEENQKLNQQTIKIPRKNISFNEIKNKIRKIDQIKEKAREKFLDTKYSTNVVLTDPKDNVNGGPSP